MTSSTGLRGQPVHQDEPVPTSPSLTEQYLAGFAASGVRAGQILDGVRPCTVDTGFMGRSLSRPAFLDRATIDRLTSDLAELHGALTGLPDRLFGGDMAAFARAVGATETQAEIILRGRGSTPSRMGRADFYQDDSGFRLLEINWGAALGGLDSAILNREMMQQPFIGDFVREHRLGYVDPMVELVHTLFTECKVPTGSTPVVALTDWPESFKTLEPRLRRNVPDYARFGIEAHPCHVGQLRYAEGRVWLGDVAIDVVYRLFMMEDLLDEAGPALIEPVLRAAERGEVTVFSPMDADLYGSKGALALLSDEANRQDGVGEDRRPDLDGHGADRQEVEHVGQLRHAADRDHRDVDDLADLVDDPERDRLDRRAAQPAIHVPEQRTLTRRRDGDARQRVDRG